MRTDTQRLLGRIESARFGFGGYQDAQFGLSLSFHGDGWGTCDFKGFWPFSMKRSELAQWSEVDRARGFADVQLLIEQTLTEAKVRDVSQLVGKPVEVEFEGGTLKNWRILKEVL